MYYILCIKLKLRRKFSFRIHIKILINHKVQLTHFYDQ